jgi:transposase
MIDATLVRAHQHAAGAQGGQEEQALGKSCGGFSTKIHAKVDALGMPLEFIVSAGQKQEMSFAHTLLGEEYSEYLLADRGYDSDLFRAMVRSRGTIPVIPGKKNRINPVEYDHYLYKERNCIERFFNRIKQFRRLATRYDKTQAIFLGSLVLIGILLWIK